jgi:hypothetical protein
VDEVWSFWFPELLGSGITMQEHLVSLFQKVAVLAVTLVGSSILAQHSIGIRFVGPGGHPTAPLMDPTEVAGVVPQANWNNISGDNGPFGYGLGPLNDANGLAVNGTILDFGCNNTWTSVGPDAPGDARLMESYLDSSNFGFTVVSIRGLSNLTPGAYDVYVYCNGDVHAGRHGFYTVGGFGGTTLECTDFVPFDPATGYAEDMQDGNGGNYVHFRNVTEDTLLFFATAQNPNDPNDNGFRAPTNAIQIVPQ